MCRILTIGALIGLLGVSALDAAILDISIAAQGDAYTNMVQDTKLRGDGGLENWNLGASLGGSMRMYANYLLDGTTASGRANTFLQRFDVSSIPPGSTINSATLITYLANQTANNRTFVNVKLSRLLPGKNWVETFQEPPGTDGPHFDGSVTWNNQVSYDTNNVPPAIAWAAPGATGAADIDLATTQTFDVVGVDGSPTAITNDIKSWVQDWVNNPTNNNGMAWWGGNSADSASGNRYFLFGVKEDGVGPASDSVAAAPTLVIDYSTSTSPSPVLLVNPNRVGELFSVSFNSQTGVNYTLQYKNVLSDTNWSNGDSIGGDGNVRTLTNSSPELIRFYRVSAF
jgi:hypothetical protein